MSSLSRSICSSKRECSTTAAAPASSIRLTLPTSSHIGDEEATSGLFSVIPRYSVERSMVLLRSVIWSPSFRRLHFVKLRRHVRPMLIPFPAAGDIFFRLFQQLSGLFRIALGQHGVARLVIDVVLQLDARGARIELERVLAFGGQCGVIAKQRPIARVYRRLLLIH